MPAYVVANIERLELLLRTSLDQTQRRIVETLLAEAREKLESFPAPAAHLHDGQTIAARNLTRDATLDELQETARDLRALSPGSALADLVDAKIKRTLAALAREEKSSSE